MRKSHVVMSTLLVLNLLALPQFAAMAAEAEAIRAQVISSDLSEAFDAEGGSTKQSTLVYITDIEHPAPIAETIATNEQLASLSLQSTDTEEGSSQEEIAAMQELISERRAESRARYIKQNTAFAEKYIDSEDVVYISRYSPVIITSLDETEVNQLALKDAVTSIELYVPSNADLIDVEVEKKTVVPLADSTEVDNLIMVRAGSATTWYSGQGIKIGMIDLGVPSAVEITQYNIKGRYAPDGTLTVTDHARAVAKVINSIAPNAELYCVEGDETHYYQAIEWLLSKNVNIINASMALVAKDGSDYNTYNSNAKWLDHLAIYHNVSFVQAAGNEGSKGVVPAGMSYNAITVGNVMTTGKIHPFSSYNNMMTKLASKPDICAPGYITLVSGETASGTSYSAPLVAGDIALMCQQKAELLAQQESIKAILSACVNRDYDVFTTEPYLESNGYKQYGAGILDCTRNYRTIRSGDYRNAYMDVSVQGAYTDYTITLGKGLPVRVALAYLQYTELSNSSHENASPIQGTLPNLDVEVFYNGNKVAYSRNPTNNIKIVEFTTPDSGTYTIRVRNVLPTDNHAYYSIAWEKG